MTTPLAALRGVDFSYGQLQVLFDVDLEIRQGEVLGLLGTNGAGKRSHRQTGPLHVGKG